MTEAESFRAALAAAADRFGPVDVLDHQPNDPALAGAMVSVMDATSSDIQRQIDFYLHGAVTAVPQVLPGMLERGSGTLLFSTGASSARPTGGAVGSISVAGAALRNYALTLSADLAERGIHAAHVAIGAFIGTGPGGEPETIAVLLGRVQQARPVRDHLRDSQRVSRSTIVSVVHMGWSKVWAPG